MTKNVGKIDRNIRLAAGAVLIVLGILSQQVLVTLIGAVLVATGAIRICPAYSLFKISTAKDGR